MSNPKVFISYSWTSEEYKNRVLAIAKLLISDGIDVVIDVWDLKIGSDKYYFMEQSIEDPSINNILVFSDMVYAVKANNREGGVGDETVIITPELYSRNCKGRFIPIVMEKDAGGNPYLPIYMRSLMYIDFSDENIFRKEYEKLLKILYKDNSLNKPALGSKPDWINRTGKDCFEMKSWLTMNCSREEAYKDIIEPFKAFYKKEYKENKLDNGKYDFEFIHDLEELLDARNTILKYSEHVIRKRADAGKELGDFLEFLHNSLTDIKTFEISPSSYYSMSFEIFRFLCWEVFICVVSMLLHFEMFKDLHNLLSRTYFLDNYDPRLCKEAMTYLGFFTFSGYIEKVIKEKLSNRTEESYAAKLLCVYREYKPICNKTAIANADLFLFQVFPGLKLRKTGFFNTWIPKCYLFSDWRESIWKKTVSIQYCEKIFPLFGVNSLEEFIQCIKKCEEARSLIDDNHYKKAPMITDLVKIDNIGIYN